MNKLLSMILVAVLCFSVFVPIRKTHAIDKIDEQIIKMGLNKTEKLPIFIELSGNTVVDDLTFNCQKTFNSTEIMRPGNILTRTALTRLKFTQAKSVDIVKNVVPSIYIGMKYKYAFNGFYAELPINEIIKVADLSFVKSVFYLKPMQVDRTRSRVILGCEKSWNNLRDLQGLPVNGSGMLVGVTDSGMDYTHNDFGNQSKPTGLKVAISRDLAYKDNDCQEENNQRNVGHGTACSGIIVADGPFNKATNVWERGLAYKAKLAAFKIGMKSDSPYPLSPEGIVASWDYNVSDKVQVSNNSYGAQGGASPMERIQNRCVLAGTCVVASQGNDGSPGPGLEIPCGNTSSADNVIGVASLDDTDVARFDITGADIGIKGSNLAFFGNNARTFSQKSVTLQVIDCGWGRKSDFEGLNLKDKVALIQRGPSADLKAQFGESILFKDKCLNAAAAGAKAMMLYNYTDGIIRASYYDGQKENPMSFNFVPSLEMYDYKMGIAIRDALHSGHDWTLGTPDKDQNPIRVTFNVTIKGNLASYTSAGPNYRGYLKPDVAAPGEQIHTSMASYMANDKKDQYWETFNGTSAAGPMVAGCATLVRQYRSTWDSLEVKRALMNTAEPVKRFSDDYYIPMIYQGMGRVNAYVAATSPILINPPSALIIANSGRFNITDIPQELYTDEGRSALDKDVLASNMPVKITNYSDKPMRLNLSYEVNSARPDQFAVNLTTTEIVVPAATKKGLGVGWFGVSVEMPPGEVKGQLNDIYIWATDKKTNQRWHIGVCIYNNNPAVQGAVNKYIGSLEYDKTKFSPNGDGVDDEIKISYEVTNGSIMVSLYENFLNNLQFWVIDQNYERWVLIKNRPFLEIGPDSFTWDGKDTQGNYVLPDGDWSIAVSTQATFVSNNQVVYLEDGYEIPNSAFAVESSTIPSLPTLQAYILPLEPGVGKPLDVGIYIHNAKNVKSMQFKINMPGSGDIVQYMGYEKGDFMLKDEPMTLFTLDFEKDKDLFDVNIQRPLDGVSGDGWLLHLKFLAKDVNYFDIQFSNLNISMVDDSMKEVKAKGFYKNSEVSIYKDAFEIADINRDGKVNDDDLKLMIASMNSKDGDTNYNWRCDLNYDKIINMEDLAIFSKYYSKH